MNVTPVLKPATSVLIVTSSRCHNDAREMLRVQDLVTAFLEMGCTVDVLVPRVTPLLTVTIDSAARIHTVFNVPFTADLPRRGGIRRFALASLMSIRAIAMLSARHHDFVYAIDDGAILVRFALKVALSDIPVICEVASPFAKIIAGRSVRNSIASKMELAAIRKSTAVVVSDEEIIDAFPREFPRARVSVIPDPHAELCGSSYTFFDFSQALTKVRKYIDHFSKDRR